jgi:hypothetical protein
MSKGGTVGKILEEQVKKKVANKFGKGDPIENLSNAPEVLTRAVQNQFSNTINQPQNILDKYTSGNVVRDSFNTLKTPLDILTADKGPNPQSTKAYDLYEYALRKKYKNEDPRGTFAQASDNYKAQDNAKMISNSLNNFNNGTMIKSPDASGILNKLITEDNNAFSKERMDADAQAELQKEKKKFQLRSRGIFGGRSRMSTPLPDLPD